MNEQAKLEHAIVTLAQISFLDLNPEATLETAVKLAEAALNEIDRDVLRVIPNVTEEKKLVVYIASAAGNTTFVEEMTPRVKALFDALNEEVGGKPIRWDEVGSSHDR